MTTSEPTQYWFCLVHELVETDDGCANTERLGPFAEYAEAATALEVARRRTETWESDPAWNDEED